MKRRIIKAAIIATLGVSILFGMINPFTLAKETKDNTGGFYKKIANGIPFSYMVIGDSIGRGSGVGYRGETWFALFEKQIRNDYGSEGKRYSIVQSGATSFEGIVKYAQEKPASPIDLVFIVFGENDRKYMDARQFSFFYEQLLRRVKTDYPHADIITFTENCLKVESFAKTIKSISSHYGAENIDMRVPFKASGLDDSKLTRDLVHPNKKGYELYAQEIAKLVKANVQSGKKQVAPIPEPLNIGLSREYREISKPSNQSGFTKSGDSFFSRGKGSFIEYQFSGEMVGYTVERGPDGGEIEVQIDGKTVDTVSTWWPFKRKRNIYLAGNLGNGLHHIRFIPTGKMSVHGSQIVKPSFRIEGIITQKDIQ